jgi:hypothetical protein
MAVARAGSDPAFAELEIRGVSCPVKFIGCVVGNFGSTRFSFEVTRTQDGAPSQTLRAHHREALEH